MRHLQGVRIILSRTNGALGATVSEINDSKRVGVDASNNRGTET